MDIGYKILMLGSKIIKSTADQGWEKVNYQVTKKTLEKASFMLWQRNHFILTRNSHLLIENYGNR